MGQIQSRNGFLVCTVLLSILGCNDNSDISNVAKLQQSAPLSGAALFTLVRSTENSEAAICLSETFAQPNEDPANPPGDKAVICHAPPGNPANAHSITVGMNAVDAHLNHHPDYLGPCDSDLEQMESALFNEFQLSLSPVDTSTLTVKVDGLAENQFTFDSSTNSVILDDAHNGSFSSVIVIDYCLEPGIGGGGGGGDPTCTGIDCGGIGV